jgi:hypothetical protein
MLLTYKNGTHPVQDKLKLFGVKCFIQFQGVKHLIPGMSGVLTKKVCRQLLSKYLLIKSMNERNYCFIAD